MLSILLATALAAAATPAATTINTHDTKVFEQQLGEMGYKVDPFEPDEKTASSAIHFEGETLAVVLGGCTKGTACTYIVLVGSFSDVLKPPADWVAKMNADFDVIKVWTRDSDGALTYSGGAMIDGMPRTTFRQWVDQVRRSGDDLADEAITAKLNRK